MSQNLLGNGSLRQVENRRFLGVAIVGLVGEHLPIWENFLDGAVAIEYPKLR